MPPDVVRGSRRGLPGLSLDSSLSPSLNSATSAKTWSLLPGCSRTFFMATVTLSLAETTSHLDYLTGLLTDISADLSPVFLPVASRVALLAHLAWPPPCSMPPIGPSSDKVQVTLPLCELPAVISRRSPSNTRCQ